ncbi:hypothetical protein [Marisediminicola senii]|uniref:hypothetical protein n=1 Tax=Marisediminicola senii TaxID=2711233 RepID=UPI00191349BD|nr:hypothetical protein [Marisediminicola senii]
MENRKRWMALAAATSMVAGIALAIPAGAAAVTTTPAGSIARGAALGHPGPSAPADPGTPAPAALTNVAHLDFLLDTATPGEVDGHTTYRLDTEPDITMPWTYADARDGGTFERVGGGPLDPATGYWGQGAYNSDDITRTAVVYLRHWELTGSDESREKAYELLRSVAYFQTTTGPNAGNVVLWMQPDGTFNPSPEPVELPDPSDSGESYWLARTIWALGEGYAAFAAEDPEFAAFLQERLQLSVGALERQTLDAYGQYEIADGVRVPAWLIVDGADASAEAVLGLAAYSEAAPDDAAARSALSKLAEGIAKMAAGDVQTWPYGAVLPWGQSRSMWHAWASQMPAALAEASIVLGDEKLLQPAIADSVQFTPTLLTAGGPDNGWFPTPVDTVQIAYGADSRLQSLLAVADATDRDGIRQLAGIMGAWYFGMNKAAEPVYDPATGVTYDGVQADGTINRNSGAESTIHGLLSMIALDANPDVSAAAQGAIEVVDRSGLTVVQAEGATSTTGEVVTPESAWTGESQVGGGAYLRMERGESATIEVGVADGPRHVEPVTLQPYPGTVSSQWRGDRRPLGLLRHGVGEQGITAAPGAILPQTLATALQGSRSSVQVTAARGTVDLDAVMLRPFVSRLSLAGNSAATQLVHSTSPQAQRTRVGERGTRAVLRSYDSSGVLVEERDIRGETSVQLLGGGFVVVTR